MGGIQSDTGETVAMEFVGAVAQLVEWELTQINIYV